MFRISDTLGRSLRSLALGSIRKCAIGLKGRRLAFSGLHILCKKLNPHRLLPDVQRRKLTIARGSERVGLSRGIVSRSIFILLLLATCRAWAQSQTGDGIWAETMIRVSTFQLFERVGTGVATDSQGNIYAAGSYLGELQVGPFLLPAFTDANYLAKYSDEAELLGVQVIRAANLLG